MKPLKEQLELTKQALDRLEEALQYSIDELPIALDAVIQRFEFTYEMLWKLVRLVLTEQYQQQCNSPRKCFKLLIRLGIFDDEGFLLDLVSARNLTAHTYNAEYAAKVYTFVKDNVGRLRELFKSLEKAAFGDG